MSSDNSFITEQESFWAGSFGKDYINRNSGTQLLASNLNFFSKSLRSTSGLGNCIEFGANIGMNLKAIQLLYPKIDLYGIEINAEAAKTLRDVIPESNIFVESILSFASPNQWDLVLIKGVLIHINPDFLPVVYSKLFEASRRYILVCEYYNPSPMSIPYRGHMNKLFKRDFAGEMLDKFPSLALVDYGFAYRRDPSFPQDDISWFLLEKK